VAVGSSLTHAVTRATTKIAIVNISGADGFIRLGIRNDWSLICIEVIGVGFVEMLSLSAYNTLYGFDTHQSAVSV